MKVGIALALVAGALAFLLVKGLGDATTYYRTADEARAVGEGERFRLEGIVVADSVERDVAGDDIEFTVESKCVQVPVHHSGNEPELFKEGIPVVLEGEWGAGKRVYESDRIVIRHTEEYTDTERDRAEAEEACRA